MDFKEKAKAIKIYIPALFIAVRRKDTPIGAKILAGITVGYALSPIDLIPDFIPVLGYLDDLILLPLLAAMAIKLIPDEVMEECRTDAEGMWADAKPNNWYYAIPIIVFWVGVAVVIAANIMN